MSEREKERVINASSVSGREINKIKKSRRDMMISF